MLTKKKKKRKETEKINNRKTEKHIHIQYIYMCYNSNVACCIVIQWKLVLFSPALSVTMQ